MRDEDRKKERFLPTEEKSRDPLSYSTEEFLCLNRPLSLLRKSICNPQRKYPESRKLSTSSTVLVQYRKNWNIIENGAGTSRISPFGLRGENRNRKDSSALD